MRAVLEVVAPGLLDTIQDGGRFGHRHEGVPVVGACDPVGLSIANAVIGNAPTAAAVECTVLGPELLALTDVVIGLAGADLGARIGPDGRPAAPGGAHRLSRGERLTFAGSLADRGCRAYLAMPGGIDVPVVLGSRSTSLVGAFGGHHGRPMRGGDRLAAAAAWPSSRNLRRWPDPVMPAALEAPIRVLPGPAIGRREMATIPELAALLAGEWRVAAASDRRGLRLDGPPIASGVIAASPSHGVLPGTIQLTPSGQPLVLLNDGGTTGGYPVIGVVIEADRWRLGQARPGAPIRFMATDPAAALAAAIGQREWLAAGTRLVSASGADPWDDLANDAGG